MSLDQLAAFLATVIGGGGLAALIQHWGKRGDQQQVFIDQMQEEVRAAREDAAAARSESGETRRELVELRSQISLFVTRDILWRWHVDRQNVEIVRCGGTVVPLPEQLQDDTDKAGGL